MIQSAIIQYYLKVYIEFFFYPIVTFTQIHDIPFYQVDSHVIANSLLHRYCNMSRSYQTHVKSGGADDCQCNLAQSYAMTIEIDKYMTFLPQRGSIPWWLHFATMMYKSCRNINEQLEKKMKKKYDSNIAKKSFVKMIENAIFYHYVKPYFLDIRGVIQEMIFYLFC